LKTVLLACFGNDAVEHSFSLDALETRWTLPHWKCT
jgi:hypothetical protein